jgi:cytochrome b
MSASWDIEGSRPLETGAVRVTRIWDGSTRLVHWLMAVLVGLSWWSAARHRMDYHRYSGYALLGVLAFRLYWGAFGSTTARFAHFVKGPRSIWRYLQSGAGQSGAENSVPGHNPLGALSVLALLGLLLGQVTLGLLSVDVDGLESGPLSHLVSFETGRACARLHRLGFDVLRVFIGLHIGAVVLHGLLRRDNLIRPMITGSKPWIHEPLPHIELGSRWHALVGVAIAVALVWYVA